MKKLFALIKKVLRIGTKKVQTTSTSVLNSLDWAEREVKEAQDKLVDLAHKLYNGVEEVEKVATTSAEIIERNKELLQNANSKSEELKAKAKVVEGLISMVDAKIKE